MAREPAITADWCWMFEANDAWYCYVPIPKAASTYLRAALPANRFNVWTWQWYDNEKAVPNKHNVRYLVVLRDPISKWITGAVEYWYAKDGVRDWGTDDLFDIFSEIDWDEHTRPQTDFLDAVDFSRTTWLWFEPDIGEISWFRNHGVVLYPVPYQERNIGELRPRVWFDQYGQRSTHLATSSQRGTSPIIIKKAIENKLYSNPSNLQRIKDYFRKDFELIQSVNFYNGLHDSNQD